MRSQSGEPPQPPPTYRRALELYREGRLRDALQACIARLSAAVDAATLVLLAHVLLDSGHVHDAAREFERALSVDPRDADAWLGLARAKVTLGQRTEALAALDKALSINPLSGEVHAMSAAIALTAGDAVAAETFAVRATGLAPTLAPAWFNLALARQQAGREAEALAAGRRAAELAPRDPASSGLCAQLEAESGDLAAARATIARAVERHPRNAALWTTAAWIGERARDLRAVVEAQTQVLALEPANGAALSQLVFARKSLIDWRGIADLQQRFRDGVAARQPMLTPFSFLSDPSTRAEQRLCAATWSAAFAPRDVFAAPSPAPAARRLRIGYLSGDFYQHPTSVLLAGVLEAHDRARVEVFAYSTGPDDASAMRRRVANAVEHFASVDARQPREVAARLRADELDVLIDLKGHTEGAPSSVLALCPAAAQAHWLGYPGTLAAPFIDYLFVDRVVVPPEHAGDYAESLVWLPDCYQPNDRMRLAADASPRAALGLGDRGFVYASFNAPWKLSAAVFDAWARVLAATPGSLLWLLAAGTSDPGIAAAHAEFVSRGIGAHRIVFAMHADAPDYLALYRVADLFLDTWPYNAHTTASDALWMRCPLVTWLGDTFAGRVGASLLAAAGLPELVAYDVEGYVALAIALAQDPKRLAALRAKLAVAQIAGALFDAAAMARHVEAACATIAAQTRAGRRESFEVARG